MRIHHYLGALLLASFSLSTVQGQEPPVSLLDAERAFADALIRHDRSAFVALFTPDAECSFPVVKHGPEAIANSWLPFLIDPGTTMLLTSTGATTGTSPDVGSTTGTFAIRGRTNNGIQTIPAGTYSIAWVVVDGHWKISMLGGAGHGNPKSVDRGGVGPFHFGMTRTEVSQVSDCRPYINVPTTGGLECANYLFEGHEMNISFLFTADGLHRIQLWFYEGTSDADTRSAVTRVLDYLQRTAGGATIAALPGVKVTPDGVMTMINGALPQPRGIASVEIGSPSRPQSEVWFSRVGRHQGGYMVMLLADPADGR